MSQAILLQDWFTVRGASSGDPVVQAFNDWADLGGYVDVIFYLDVSSFSGSPSVRYQTSPMLDESLFASMANVSVNSTGLTQTVIRYASASVPLRRWVRWRLDGASAYAVTFRIWMAVRPG
ncbi:MAG: hypothetical protein HUU55_22420 [Myxococcales bacterium]|nr:hypothetical protein [Myxococcales bacterium]